MGRQDKSRPLVSESSGEFEIFALWDIFHREEFRKEPRLG
jgi:hypothetical protein